MRSCQCVGQNAVEVIGLCDPDSITFQSTEFPTDRNWTEISIPEVLPLPCEKPNIESIDKVFIHVKIISKRIVNTATGTNLENMMITGNKMIIEGILQQKVVYTADTIDQSVHAAHFDVPFSAFIVLPAGADVINKSYCLDVCVEDVFAMAFNCRAIFKNVTLFLRAVPEVKVGCA